VFVFGLAATATPLLTGPIPLSMLPVPLVNTGVIVVLVPAVMVEAAALKLEISGDAAEAGAGKNFVSLQPARSTSDKPNKTILNSCEIRNITTPPLFNVHSYLLLW
jgi:hypothetical protein